MSLFTHQYSTNTPAEINPAAEYFGAVVVCRNYVESTSKHRGTVYTQEYRDLERAGFRFVGHAPGDGSHFKHAVMVKPTTSAAEGNPQYGSDFNAFNIIPYGEGAATLRVVFRYQWDSNFAPSVIAGDCVTEDMRAHLINLASKADKADVAAYAERF